MTDMLCLEPLSESTCETARWWRNDESVRPTLRTPYMLTEEQQREFYRNVVCNRNAPHRYWGLRVYAGPVIGMGGLTNIEWENGLAEISLLIDPALVGRGYGKQAVRLLLCEAFDRMRLRSVIGECYMNNPAIAFWGKILGEYKGDDVVLPRRKFWDGAFYSSMYFTITSEGWREACEKEARTKLDEKL